MKVKIKKEKLVMTITIAIACFTLMLVMFMQFKVVRQTDITAIESMRESELRIELANWQEKYDELNEKHEEITQKISEYQDEKESDEKTAKLLEQELAEINKLLGKTDVQGEGIQIILTDKSYTDSVEGGSSEPIYDEDLLVIVNQLFEAGAEAISINDQRIVAMSDIVLLDSSIIKVNGQRLLSPYVIKAIGNKEYLKSAVMGKGGRGAELSELGYSVDVEESDKILIEKYDGTFSTKYMN